MQLVIGMRFEMDENDPQYDHARMDDEKYHMDEIHQVTRMLFVNFPFDPKVHHQKSLDSIWQPNCNLPKITPLPF
jgi:hypothetical protein